jgi:hypothetical protein
MIEDAIGGAEFALISTLSRAGVISAQVPARVPSVAEPGVYEDAKVSSLIKEGIVAWKIVLDIEKSPAITYTVDPLNPPTPHAVAAFLWMTKRALDLYGDDLYKIYARTCHGAALSMDKWGEAMRKDVIPNCPEVVLK